MCCFDLAFGSLVVVLLAAQLRTGGQEEVSSQTDGQSRQRGGSAKTQLVEGEGAANWTQWAIGAGQLGARRVGRACQSAFSARSVQF